MGFHFHIEQVFVTSNWMEFFDNDPSANKWNRINPHRFSLHLSKFVPSDR